MQDPTEPSAEPCGHPTSAAEPARPDLGLGSRRGAAVPGGRPRHHHDVSRDKGRPCSPTSTSPSRRCASPYWACGSSCPDPPCRVAPQRTPSTTGLRDRLALLPARADE